jgi:small subunit ribosomal protein S9
LKVEEEIEMAIVCYRAIGRRKTSVAKVILKSGSGKVVINGRSVDDYLKVAMLKEIVYKPLKLTGTVSNFDIFVQTLGGGLSGQAGAISLAISRALVIFNSDFRQVLKKSGYLTRDSRQKERKKYGLKAARKAPQFSKR